MSSKSKKNSRWLTFKLGRGETVLDTTKEFSSSKEDTLSSEKLWYKKVGMRIRTFGLLITTLNGPQKYVILTI